MSRQADLVERSSLRWVLAVVPLLLLLLWEGSAWACVPQPRLVSLQPMASGPSGTQVTVNALGFDPGRAEVRWNAPDGELLADGNGPSFSLPITIPQTPEGLYAVIVISRDVDGGIGNTGSTAFQVLSTGASSAGPRASTADGTTSHSGTSTAVTDASSSSDANAIPLILEAATLLVLGGLGGAWISRRVLRNHAAK